jgi:hypothetical protein
VGGNLHIFQRMIHVDCINGVPRIFFGWGVQQIQLRTGQRERGLGGGSPLVRGSALFANE